jgi:hypothetical protein
MATTAAAGSGLSGGREAGGSAACEGPGRVLDPASGSSVEQHDPTSTVKMLLVSSRVGSGWAARVGCGSVSKVTRGLTRNTMHRRLSRTPGPQRGADLPSPSVRERENITYKCEHGEPSRMTTDMPNRTAQLLDHSASRLQAGCKGRSGPGAVPVGPRDRRRNRNRTGRVVPLTMVRRRWPQRGVVRKPSLDVTLVRHGGCWRQFKRRRA